MKRINLITVTGPTATGKTSFAAHLAQKVKGEIISADSRQVYRGMDIGSGKDISDYHVDNQLTPYHLVDIAEAGYKYNVFEFQNDFVAVLKNIWSRQRMPLLCGGTGLYIEAALKGYKLINVPPNESLRLELEKKSLEELSSLLASMKKLHNTSDSDTKKRAIRGIEIELYYRENPEKITEYPKIHPIIFALHFERKEIRERITFRLKQRLQKGMIEEVERLLKHGLSPEDLTYYGLEYKFLTLYLTGTLSYNDMFNQLNTAIHQFAKRQMTWFRRMERNGFIIHWIDGHLPISEKIEIALKIMESKE